MAKAGLLFLLFLGAFILQCQGNERKPYIVYMGDKPEGDFSASAVHHSILETVLGSASLAKKSRIRSYGRSFNGFAAKLTDEEVEKFREMEGVVSVIPNRVIKLHTTRSWDFMGFSRGKLGAPIEGDVIIGFLDTGIWPESESFNDEGMSSPPTKWKGKCTGANFTCNNKIIGARYYGGPSSLDDESDIKSPRDSEGHGSHTASTAAGREVKEASYFGLAEGVARGGVPNARIAVYKVCWSFGCSTLDILAAFDDAIADGVDIISISVGDDWPNPYWDDVIAIGSFHAMGYGILTSASAGNDGPFPHTVSNYAPWTLTVAASTIDRKFVSQVVLGNGQVFSGMSINNFDLNGTSYPLVWGGDATNYSAGSTPDISRYCYSNEMNLKKIAGAIVYCEGLLDDFSFLTPNGVGTIMSDYDADYAFNYPLPATQISNEDGQKVWDYIKSTKNPIATILVGETWNDAMAPTVVSFSSRGPNPVTPDVLKPDITAPGVDILAAWSPLAPPSFFGDTRKVKFNIISGTSMSCPHATAAAAYVKAAHPKWSPAAIKSAIMTTAIVMDPRKHPDLEFGYGSGHINPAQALSPGLVYNATEVDYINFLCKQGYNTTTLRTITGTNSSCSSTVPGRAWDLNYPTFVAAMEDGRAIKAIFTRRVTNVGAPNSTYTVTKYMPNSISITVEPSVLTFSKFGEEKTFTVKLDGPSIEQEPIMSGAIVWTDEANNYIVRSPVVVYTILPGATYVPPYASQMTPKYEGSTKHHNHRGLRRN
ncbi:hypothetical protein Tsubulata_001993 [Turnera subulata]|uniref:Cucumisin-like n=1 Tax=Turnera subulata TaxID=218843 RepID=A0A9Q0FKX1_9ROSI|nr:hypothetical protein Tsubulata_001993 [Turnera subulata]